ncbi:hypothetical protein [Reyranella sp. CPCC 100927]|uniref:hypothetical protein n=1 Tax=Reyranella sp. CPCC 100927 TaxID=2599616 RepID=UPI0011B885C8|nr:hypothetical protein [Reyranella sp. CPCC 100927]TWT10633.1 hypothetical protein FQU96_16065 [Reyranella sp. CPCC 100927]
MKTLIEHRPPPPWTVGPSLPPKVPLRGPWIALPMLRMNTVGRLLIGITTLDGIDGRAVVKIEGRDSGRISTLATVQKPESKNYWNPDRVALRMPWVRATIVSVDPDTIVMAHLDA